MKLDFRERLRLPAIDVLLQDFRHVFRQLGESDKVREQNRRAFIDHRLDVVVALQFFGNAVRQDVPQQPAPAAPETDDREIPGSALKSLRDRLIQRQQR